MKFQTFQISFRKCNRISMFEYSQHIATFFSYSDNNDNNSKFNNHDGAPYQTTYIE